MSAFFSALPLSVPQEPEASPIQYISDKVMTVL
jgi:hypothetical protein